MYLNGTYIVDSVGNNEFSYQERIALGSKGKIFIPSLIQGTLADLEEGSEIVFEEIENNKLVSCTGLKHFVQTTCNGIPTYIFDNHNHALFFRYRHTAQLKAPLRPTEIPLGINGETKGDLQEPNKPFILIHIDQHADTKENNAEFKVQNSEGIEYFVNTKTNVGNFISAALHNNIIDEVIQVRSNYTLKQLGTSSFKLGANYILDIDVDFREQKSEQEMESDFEIIRKLVDNVCLITIATSPYFMDQKKAIEIIKDLLK